MSALDGVGHKKFIVRYSFLVHYIISEPLLNKGQGMHNTKLANELKKLQIVLDKLAFYVKSQLTKKQVSKEKPKHH